MLTVLVAEHRDPLSVVAQSSPPSALLSTDVPPAANLETVFISATVPGVVIGLSLLTFVSTMVGGVFALRHRDRLHLILGFTAGVILGVVAFDVLPEISDLAQSTHTSFEQPMIALAAGFLVFHGIEKWLLVHNAHEEEYAGHHHRSVGVASAVALAGHSLADGVAIGLAFQVRDSVGVAVAIAVIGHDFADGLNTVALMLRHGNDRRRAAAMLAVDAIAPVVGAASTLLFSVPDQGLLVYLGVFAGFLLYIGASDILPEAHADHPSLATFALTVTGAVFLFLVIRAIG
jgi:ZIP family zinc transporter